MSKLLKIIPISMVILMISIMSYPKRMAPKPVKPVIYQGIKYQAIHWGKSRGFKQNGGYIEAFKVSTGKRLWVLKVYHIQYGRLTGDAYDNFITKMWIKNGYLYIENEKDDTYKINLKTHEVTEVE